jgi:hypothetical protein
VGGFDQHVCRSGEHCRAFDPVTKHAYPTGQPLCDACLEHAQPAITGLTFDYLDLAQLHEPAMSQAPSEHTSGGAIHSPMPLAAHVTELQAEIVHVVSVWEYELRVAHRLSDPRTFAPLWRRTVYDQIELTQGARQIRPARPGAIVQRAVGIISHRLGNLARMPSTLVCPTGVDDEPIEMAGWEAVHQLQALHGRTRGLLGRTVRKFWIYGDCWACPARNKRGEDGPLWRSEPLREDDPMQVNCSACNTARPYPDYERYMAELEWPELEAAA